MSLFLKLIAGFYLVILWLVVAGFLFFGPSTQVTELDGVRPDKIIIFLSGLGMSIPAAVLFAFGQVVDDIRESRDHLAAMRHYYEPQ